MADDLALMSAGRILQRGTPEDCYREPVSIAAARLLGEAEVIPARIADGVAHTAFGTLPAPGIADGDAQAMLRPNALIPGPGAQAAVSHRRFVGQGWSARLRVDGTSVQVRLVDRPDDLMSVGIDPAQARVFG